MFSRAGLAFYIFVLVIALTAAAPIPNDNGVSLSGPGVSISRRAPRARHSVDKPEVPLNVDASHIPSNDNAIISSVAYVASSVHPREVMEDIERRNIFKKMKHAFKKIGKSIKKAAKKITSGIKKAASKTVGFVKANAAKIAKVGLKAIAAATKIGSRFAGYIPGVGKVLGKAMAKASSAANSASDHIHANIGGELGKAMAGMNKAEKYASYIPRELSENGYIQGRSSELSFNNFDARNDYEWESGVYGRDDSGGENLYERDLEFSY